VLLEANHRARACLPVAPAESVFRRDVPGVSADVAGRAREDDRVANDKEVRMSATETRVSEPLPAVATYRAAVVNDFGAPLALQEVPRLGLEPGQVRVKVEATGLCHTDIHAAHGDWPVKPSPPFIPGHEGVGIVAELGPGVTEVALGDRVAMPWLGYACGTCDYCVSGWETLCLEQKNMGYSIDGGLGEYATAFARYVVEVPDGVDPFDAAPLTCAGVTTYKAVKVAGTRPSDLVAVFGVGGLGHLAIQYATIAGGRVVAVDLHDEKLELAKDLGAEFVVNAAQEDPVEAIQWLGGVDQAIALAVSPRAFEQAYASLRRGGTLVFVALPAENHVELPIFETVLNGITVVGSIVGTRADLREVFELHAAGRTRVIRETRPLSAVNQAIADVEAGRVAARIVFQP
jgi:propanol-preferring alcohol dehydrogenase